MSNGLSFSFCSDGELIIMKKGVPDFEAMLRRSRTSRQRDIERQVRVEPATYVVFDILEKDNQSLVDLPLLNRKEVLKQSVKEGSYCCLADYIDGKGEDYFRLIASHGLEGIMAKKKDSVFEEGERSDCWLKIKNLRSVDCVIFGYVKGVGNQFASVIVGLYNKKQRPVYVASVEYGFTQGIRSVLGQFFEEITIGEEDGIICLKPMIVCEVRYQSVLSGFKLRFPRFHRIRLDKSPDECTIDQIRETKITPVI